jgi:hypothetical protein
MNVDDGEQRGAKGEQRGSKVEKGAIDINFEKDKVLALLDLEMEA